MYRGLIHYVVASEDEGGITDDPCGVRKDSKLDPFPHSKCKIKCKASACNAGHLGSIPGSGRSPGVLFPLQYSCLENPMDGGT